MNRTTVQRKRVLTQATSVGTSYKPGYLKQLWLDINKEKLLYCMLIPGLLFFVFFKYLPMLGVVIAFQDYQPFAGILKSHWVGLQHFQRFFTNPDFWKLFRNTLVLAVYNLLFFFPLPIILALMLNEVRKEFFKRFVQTIIYIPHFISWVVVAGLTYTLFTTEGGIVNEALAYMGGDKINFLLSKDWFRSMITSQVIWKETGWGTIIFLAALSGVDQQLYEAARMDGANRWHQLWHITLPAIQTTIVLLLILRLGSFLDTGFEQIFLMLNSGNREVAEVFDTYVYTSGLVNAQFSYSTAVGLFKSLVSLILVVSANAMAKKYGEEGVY
ncbi:putative multiple-sugar transport system permease YteP [Paenibacillus allorhizoplanae]|uniref:Multiple-sugar transport system permease YteP n=2 Tax=Paenibacillus TaxID=44249 RepID=A0ABN8H4F3_9BACL|nr:sugar ABC transporter permease [Paenibacillus allorhizoplanae]CAH1223350.1 putative multiple-sugar transport system permease YteP [Paenibacillus allorhizoplanae]